MPHRVHPGSPACRFDCLHSRQQMHSDHVCELSGSRPLPQKAVCSSFEAKGRQRRKWSRRDLEDLLEKELTPEPQISPATPGLPHRPILVVDDDDSIVTFVQSALKEEGYDVLTAANGQAALQQAATAHPWLVLLDLSMPRMDGWAVARELRDQTRGACRLVFMSAQRANPEMARSLGAVDWLSKPFGIGDLLRCVDVRWTAAPDFAPGASGEAVVS